MKPTIPPQNTTKIFIPTISIHKQPPLSPEAQAELDKFSKHYEAQKALTVELVKLEREFNKQMNEIHKCYFFEMKRLGKIDMNALLSAYIARAEEYNQRIKQVLDFHVALNGFDLEPSVRGRSFYTCSPSDTRPPCEKHLKGFFRTFIEWDLMEKLNQGVSYKC